MDALLGLQDIALFVELARTKSFSGASKKLDIPASTLSRRIAAMEKRVGVQLFIRSTRHVELTDAAQRYFDRCAPLVDEARVAQEALYESASDVSGLLRISMPVDFGLYWVAPELEIFTHQYPGITLELDLSARQVDLLREPFDLAVRLGKVTGDSLIAKRIGDIPLALYASPNYLARTGRPECPADLSQHNCLHFSSSARTSPWIFHKGRLTSEIYVSGRVSANNISMMRVLALSGTGVAILPEKIARESVAEGQLEQVLAEYELAPIPVHVVMTTRLQPSTVRTFINFLSEQVK